MTIFLPALVAILLSVAFTPLTIFLAKKYKLVDDPKNRPHPAHIQNRIVPRAGGLPVFLSIIIATLAFVPFDKHILGIFLSLSLLLVVGLLDDRLKNFSPYPRLLLQLIAALIAVASGIGITFITNPLGGIIYFDQIIIPISFLGVHNIIVIADIFAVLWIVWMMNMVNWAKGVDGQMPGIITVAAATIGILSYKLFLAGDPNQLYIAILSFITAGASLGLLVFQWYPAKIFPGFSGSTILGFMVAVLSILSGAKLATALLVLLVPATDFFYTFFRRIFSGHSPLLGDQKHLHHLLLKKGWSHRQISLFYILVSVILGAAALSLDSRGKLFAAIAAVVALLGGIIWLNFFGGLSKRSVPANG